MPWPAQWRGGGKTGRRQVDGADALRTAHRLQLQRPPGTVEYPAVLGRPSKHGVCLGYHYLEGQVTGRRGGGARELGSGPAQPTEAHRQTALRPANDSISPHSRRVVTRHCHFTRSPHGTRPLRTREGAPAVDPTRRPIATQIVAQGLGRVTDLGIYTSHRKMASACKMHVATREYASRRPAQND